MYIETYEQKLSVKYSVMMNHGNLMKIIFGFYNMSFVRIFHPMFTTASLGDGIIHPRSIPDQNVSICWQMQHNKIIIGDMGRWVLPLKTLKIGNGSILIGMEYLNLSSSGSLGSLLCYVCLLANKRFPSDYLFFKIYFTYFSIILIPAFITRVCLTYFTLHWL